MSSINDRRSSLSWPLPIAIPPAPDGVVDASDRRQVAGMYAFTPSGPPPTPPQVLSVDVWGEDCQWLGGDNY